MKGQGDRPKRNQMKMKLKSSEIKIENKTMYYRKEIK